MPIRRKVIGVGDSKAVTIPKGWFDLVEKLYGGKVDEVALEIDNIIKVFPIINGKVIKEEI